MFLAENKLGMQIEERRISIDEALKADEVFCAGTAAIISPIGSIKYQDKEYEFSEGNVGKITRQLYDILTGIQFGESEDEYGWITKL